MSRIYKSFANTICKRSRPFLLQSCLLIAFVATSGCARNHYYIEPNGQVTSVGHQPFWGPTRGTATPVQMAEVPTTIAGAKVVSSAPTANSATVGVVNPAIPEAIVVQQPANAGAAAEPGLITSSGSDDVPATSVSGGVRKIAKSTGGPSIE
jgi:hypothetical protein